MSLAEDVLDEGSCIYVDNHHSSFGLLNELGKCTTDVIGTVRKYYKTLPKDVANSKLNKRETKTAYSPQYNVIIPLLINIYNNVMGGVDRSDQRMDSYPAERERLKKWYKKM